MENVPKSLIYKTIEMSSSVTANEIKNLFQLDNGLVRVNIILRSENEEINNKKISFTVNSHNSQISISDIDSDIECSLYSERSYVGFSYKTSANITLSVEPVTGYISEFFPSVSITDPSTSTGGDTTEISVTENVRKINKELDSLTVKR